MFCFVSFNVYNGVKTNEVFYVLLKVFYIPTLKAVRGKTLIQTSLNWPTLKIAKSKEIIYHLNCFNFSIKHPVG